jgi:hypothetical protein
MLPNIHTRDAGKQSLDGGITVSPETGNDDHVAAVDRDIGSALGYDDDIGDGILTLPAAIAIRNPKTATMFCYPDQRKREEPGPALQAALREAEQVLDELAAQACHEAAENAPRPKGPDRFRSLHEGPLAPLTISSFQDRLNSAEL